MARATFYFDRVSTIAVDRELFWGDDQLERAAIRVAAHLNED